MARRVESEQRVLERLRELCLSLPETRETMTWGHPNFRAGAKIFAAFHADRDGSPCVWIRVDPMTRELIRDDPRIETTAQGGAYWLGLQADHPLHWGLVRQLLLEGYRLMAPKRTAKRLELETPPAPRWAR